MCTVILFIMIEIAAAIIENREGKFFVARRKSDIRLGGYWMFPGGRIEDGETPCQCIIRELQQSMDMHIECGDIFTDVVYDYGDRVVHLVAIRSILHSGHIRLHDYDDIRWITLHEMNEFLFAQADALIVERLQQQRRLHQNH